MTEDRAYNSARNRQNSAIGFLVPGVAAQKSRQSPPTPEPGTARSSRSSQAHLREPHTDSAGLAPAAISHDVAHPRDFLDRTSRAERRSGFPAFS